MDTTESLTSRVLTHHLTAFGNNDLDEIMNDYTEESQVFTPGGLLSGLSAIRKFFEEFFLAIPSGSAFEMKQLTVRENVAYIVWASETSVENIPLGTDTFFFEGDKIRYHTVADYRLKKY